MKQDTPAATSDAVPAKPQTPVKRRSRVAIIVCAVLALVGAALAYAGSQEQGQVQAVVTKSDVARGERLEMEDLTTIAVSKDVGDIITPEHAKELVGLLARVDLPKGSLLRQSVVTSNLGVQANQSIVGIGVTRVGAPSRQLVAGDSVRVVYAPAEGTQGDKAPEADVPATVEQVFTTEDPNLTIVEVSVASDQASKVARWSAGNSAALVLDSEDTSAETKQDKP